MEHRALGKGLSALIPDRAILDERKENHENVTYLKTSLIEDNRQQPRLNYDEGKMTDLINSIKEKGFLQPVVVREIEGGYEIVAGERRLKAARALNIEEIPVVVKNVSSEEAFVLALIENIQREDLNPIEQGKAFRRLIEQFHMTPEDVAKSVGKDRSTISNLIRLLRLPDDIQGSVFSGELSMGHARALLSLEGEEAQRQIFTLIQKKGLSVREVETLVQNQGGPAFHRKRKENKSQEIALLEDELQQILGTKVRIETKKKRGKIIVEYYSLEDLERILHIFKKAASQAA